MAKHQVLLLVFCGEICRSLCAAAPHHTAVTETQTFSTARSPGADKALLYLQQAAGRRLHQADSAMYSATEPQAFPAEEEAGDGSWVAALIIGIILIGMTTAIIVILLWKCCLRPARAETHWAGRSPFADGDTPELCMDPEQGTRRSSVLFMLPWRSRQGTNLQEDAAVPEHPPQHTTSAENGQLPLPAQGCSEAATEPAPASEAASSTANSCPHPDTPAEPSDLPPPPDWLRGPAEDPSKHSGLHWETEEPLPPPPELLLQESHGSPPQPEHPL